ncbi:hypothetical protein MHM98_12170 [Psychrobium sp. MM17-31]|uniref:DUF2971 domain-containing protein n=1 Tax=Psychrobium sp. MM17-31 TaxID=2917758 RepID=UPI001EF46562|nr:DUF2971 domain-containing protein [Psychrobium sp. MM17-31]MCG7532089.1 hypothetical protein [Psychrobium sp. MM17-31]
MENNLYHYTSGHGLLGIVEQSNLWSTHFRFMNDTKEIKEAYNVTVDNYELITQKTIIKVNEKHKRFEETSKSLLSELENMLEKYAMNAAFYITSFTTERDNLAHWLTYGGGNTSYCLNFERDSFTDNKLIIANTTSELVDVKYFTDKDEVIDELVNELASIIIECFDRYIDGWSDEKYSRFFGVTSFELCEAALFFFASYKNEKFKDEKEVRFITSCLQGFTINGDESFDYYEARNEFHPKLDEKADSFMVESTREDCFRISAIGTVVPYIKYPIELKNIKEIIIGPCEHKSDSAFGMKSMTTRKNLSVEITSSHCPFRNI